MGTKYEIVDEVRYDLFRRMLPQAALGTQIQILIANAEQAAAELEQRGIVRRVPETPKLVQEYAPATVAGPDGTYLASLKLSTSTFFNEVPPRISGGEEGFDATKGEI